jgi:hypothetical protein
MKSFIEVIKEADETQARLKFIQDPKSSSKSIANLARSEDLVVRNAAEEELKRRRDSGDQDAAAHVQPPKDASIHTAQTQVGGEQAQAQEKETKTKEVDPNRIAPVKKGSGRDILNNLNKGKTISGDAPNAIELNPQYIIRADGIKEAAMKSVVFSFGRMNPPTVGHEKLVDKIQAVAKANKADARLFLSRTEGDDKNPLPYSDKLKLAKMAFPGIVQDTPKSMYPAGFIGLLKMLEDKYDKVIIVVGSDRLANIKSLANKYNGSEYKFEEIEVVSAGERDPDEEGVGGMSASKMRAAAKAGDLAKFKSGLPSRLKSAAKLVMDKLKQYLSEDLDEAVLTLSQRLKRRSQFRRARGKIILGQKRARARKASSKQISRRSKRIAIKLIRKRILRNRKYQDLSYGARAAVDRQVARRKSAIARIAKRIEPRLRQAENRRKSGGGYASISLSGPVKKKKLKEEITYGNLIHSVNAIMKRIIAEENYSLAPLEQASLVRKSNETGVPVKVIKEVYTRGVASWNMGLREDTTPQQWGFARVNSFLAGGFNAYTADRDLLEADDAGKHETLAIIAKKETSSDSLRNYTRNQDQEIADAAEKELEKRKAQGDQEAGAALDDYAKERDAAQATQAAGQVNVMATPSSSVGGTEAIIKSVETLPKVNQQSQPVDGQPDKEAPPSAQDVDAAAKRISRKAAGKAVKQAVSNLGPEKEDLDKEMKEKKAELNKLKKDAVKNKDAIEKLQTDIDGLNREITTEKMIKKLEDLAEKHKSSFISGSDLDRFNSMIKGYKDFVNADTEEDQVEALRYLAENNLISSHSGGKKIYVHSNVLGGMKGNETVHDELRKKLAPDKGDTFSLEANRLIEKYGIEIEPGDDPGRLLADLSGKLHEAGIAALIHPSPENTEAAEKLRDRFVKAGGDLDIAEKQNEDAAKELRDYIQLLHEGAEIVSSQQVGGLGPNKLKELGITPLTDPTDVIVTIKDKSGNLINKKFSFKTYDNVNNITMKNSGTDKAGETWLGGEIGKKIDEKLKKMKSDSKYIYWADDIDKAEVKRRKEDLKKDYLKEFGGSMADLAKTKDGQEQLKDIWLKVHGCGNDVATLITNKKTNKTEIKPPDYYCNPKGNFKVSIDGTKVVVNMEESSEGDEPVRMLQLDFKTEKRGSTKMLWRHIVVKPKAAKKASPTNKGAKAKARQDNISSEVSKLPKKSKKQKNESFLSFGDFLMESADMAVGNQPTVNPKPIHHKASGHKYHVHHMVNPNLGMMHQVKHAVDRKDLDIDGDTDEFDKPKAGIPDEIGVGTTPTTKKMFAKYSKELSHIHAGEPVDEQKITPKYTGDENSWYLDASNQKVRVYAQADLKQPEDVGKFLKKPTQQKDIGTIMSMNDFLKTQPEKKK